MTMKHPMGPSDTDLNREGTQGDAAAGDPAAGASLSVGEDHLTGPEQWDMTLGGPVVDTTDLEALFEDLEYPTAKSDILTALEQRGDDNPISGVNVPEVIAGLDKERFMNPAELTQAVREDLSRRSHSA